MSVGSNPLIRKLENYVRLSHADRAAIDRISGLRVRQVAAREDVIREGDAPIHLNLFLSGWACRYKQLEDGRRQIVGFLLPGDLCEQNMFVLRQMDFYTASVTPLTLAEIPRDAVQQLTIDHPRITQALWWEALVTGAIQREWAVNLGQRNALERIGHLLCEIYVRLESVGLAEDGVCEFPITQVDLGDAMGLSAVHVNRSLQELRATNLIQLKGRILTIPDLKALKRASLFNDNYLHLDREGSHLDANEV